LHDPTNSGLSGKEITKPDRQALEHLIQVTRDVTEIDVEGQAWIVSAMAQRASSRVKIVASIE
jgi:membrane protein implicated in regulation of membrane protease activity